MTGEIKKEALWGFKLTPEQSKKLSEEIRLIQKKALDRGDKLPNTSDILRTAIQKGINKNIGIKEVKIESLRGRKSSG